MCSVDLENQKYEIHVDIPALRIEAEYHVDGKILLMPIRGHGDMVANMSWFFFFVVFWVLLNFVFITANLNAEAFLQGEIYEQNGENYLKYTSLELKIKIGGGKVRLSNLFGGDKILSGFLWIFFRISIELTFPLADDVINDTINKNLDMYLKELLPVIEKALGNTFLKIGNSIVESFTYKQLFPHWFVI